jgi:GntR family transcriptional regulator, phosphonate transport system regulatory protein
MTTMPLDRGQGVSLWRQIATTLEREIATGTRRAGERLPTEAVLSAQFNVNRHTVRRALEALTARGLVRVEQGRGSFVAEDVLDYPLGGRTRFSETIRRQNREPQGRILELKEMPSDSLVADALGIRRGRPVLRVVRLGLADGKPIVIGKHHFPLPRFTPLADLLHANASISAALAACRVPDYRRRVTRVTARMPTPEEASLLEQSRTRPVLASEALNTDAAGQAVDFTLGCYAAGRVQIVVESDS